jgi:hypothetical protein
LSGQAWALLADLVLSVHVGFVFFVVAGLLIICIGGALHWRWVRNRSFRYMHVAAIGIVVAQSWLGARCPLTTLEMALRRRAGGATYPGDFIAHYLESALYYSAPDWVFITAYTAFFACVVGAWILVRPGRNPEQSAL